MKRISLKRITTVAAIIISAAVLLGGCFGAAVGTGAWVATAASDKRGLKNATIDLAIRTRINNLWLDYSEELITKANITIFKGRVLLTGIVSTEKLRMNAVRLAWQAKGTKEVINEIQVSNVNSITDYARDGWISAQLKTTLALDKQVAAINYSIEVVRGSVYLLGIAVTPTELERVKNHARQIKYVRRVVSYVIIENAKNTSL